LAFLEKLLPELQTRPDLGHVAVEIKTRIEKIRQEIRVLQEKADQNSSSRLPNSVNKEPREIILSSTLLFASLAILAPLASAQQCGFNPANLTFDSIYGGGGAVACAEEGNPNCVQKASATLGHEPGEDSKKQPSNKRIRGSKPADFNRDIYYRNKLEFSLDGGWLPINIPFPLDVFVGAPYNTYPLKYTLVPIIASLRWHMNDVGGPWILRGNWDLTFSGSVTAIPRGPETRYFAYIMGIRRNFVPRSWRIVPYFDTRLGLGNIDAKGPNGVKYAQGQDFTFTVNMGSGVRYNFNPRFAISAGMHFMHISNLDLSQGNGRPNWGITNYGINVYGPMFGIDIQLRRHQRHSEQ
jgi:hypothetical protein